MLKCLVLSLVLTTTLIGCSGGGNLAPKSPWGACDSQTIDNLAWSPDSALLLYTISDPAQGMTLYAADLASGNRTRLAKVPAGTTAPVWSPDSTHIAYVTRSAAGKGTLSILDLLTGSTTELAQIPTSQTLYPPAWSPHPDSILIGADMSINEYEVFTIGLEGSTTVLRGPTQGQLYMVQRAPGTGYIAVGYTGLATIDPRNDLLILSPHGEVVWRIKDDLRGYSWAPVDWSPDGTHLAIGGDTTSAATLTVVSLPGGAERVTNLRFSPFDPIKWSPDGRWIAVPLGMRDGVSLVRADNAEIQELYIKYMPVYQWLPDSSGFLITSQAGEIISFSVEGSRTTLFAGVQGTDFSTGAFSPDGTQIAYLHPGSAGAEDLYVMNIDGTNQRQLVDNPGNHKCFQWPF
jgi:Tol biopolymer transport system component